MLTVEPASNQRSSCPAELIDHTTYGVGGWASQQGVAIQARDPLAVQLNTVQDRLDRLKEDKGVETYIERVNQVVGSTSLRDLTKLPLFHCVMRSPMASQELKLVLTDDRLLSWDECGTGDADMAEPKT